MTSGRRVGRGRQGKTGTDSLNSYLVLVYINRVVIRRVLTWRVLEQHGQLEVTEVSFLT